MSKTKLLGTTLALAASLALAADTLDMKPGLWTMTATLTELTYQLPKALLALTPVKDRPKALADAEATMRRNFPYTQTECIAAADIAAARLGKPDDDDSNCHDTLTAISKTHFERTDVCTGDFAHRAVTRTDMVGRDRYTGTMTSDGLTIP